MKKVLVLAMVALSSMSILAYDACIDGIYYNFSKDEAMVTYYSTNVYGVYKGTVIIPESVTYNGKSYSVTGIGERAFISCTNLTSVTIPNSVTNIANQAFSGCNGLTSVHITNLAAWCKISFGDYASNNPLYYANRLFLNGQEIKDLVIPDSVTSISSKAFCGCSSLTSITIPNSVTSIGSSVFSDCTGLTSITIPNSVTSIGNSAFSNCPRLKHIYVSSQIPTDCSGTATFYCDSGVRNGYDVYNYAVLHVPMGSKEEYAAAYEWRYFLKIKEDLDINGQVFYTTLSVNQAGDGYVKHYVKADEPYTLFIGSEAGMRINTVMFNGEDVTDRMIDGYYTTPNITRPSKIVVSYEQDPDGFAYVPSDSKLHIYGYEGSLFVSGIEEPQSMSVYTLDGKLTSTQTLEGDTKIKLNEGIYIVKVGERTFKVSL